MSQVVVTSKEQLVMTLSLTQFKKFKFPVRQELSETTSTMATRLQCGCLNHSFMSCQNNKHQTRQGYIFSRFEDRLAGSQQVSMTSVSGKGISSSKEYSVVTGEEGAEGGIYPCIQSGHSKHSGNAFSPSSSFCNG